MTSRRNIMLGTAGHVDHGKTALVKLLTGCETDTLAEEKQRGLTIDLGFAPCQLADKRVVGVVDVPGHVDFIRNMVAGAHGIDVVIFVVAADDGIMPQTHEHLHILTLMGLRHGLVALTKIDLVDAARRDFCDPGFAAAARGNVSGRRANLPAFQRHRRRLRWIFRRAERGGRQMRRPPLLRLVSACGWRTCSPFAAPARSSPAFPPADACDRATACICCPPACPDTSAACRSMAKTPRKDAPANASR